MSIRQAAFPAANLTRGSGGSEEMQRVRATKGSAALTPPHRPRPLVSLRTLLSVINMRPPRQPSLRPFHAPRLQRSRLATLCVITERPRRLSLSSVLRTLTSGERY